MNMNRMCFSGAGNIKISMERTIRSASSTKRCHEAFAGRTYRMCSRYCTAKGSRQMRTYAEKQSAETVGKSSYSFESYANMLVDVANAVSAGIEDNLLRMEVEFPPLPVTDSYSEASDNFIDANVQYALVLGRKLTEQGKKARIIVPDAGELRRSSKMFASALDMNSDLSMGSLSEAGDWAEDFRLSINSLFGNSDPNEEEGEPPEDIDAYIVVNVSCSELNDLSNFVDKFAESKSVILMNLELETLRGDLGLLGFPSKDMHYAFLSSFKPVYFIRKRDYSKTITVSPYLVNYSGAIYREYPGQWQVLLEKDTRYIPVDRQPSRYTLSDAKYKMMEAMGLRTEEEGSALEFLRRGYKNSTWWEDPNNMSKEASDAWRS